MSRSTKKGPYVDEKLLKKVSKASRTDVIRTWARSSTVVPEMIGFTMGIHNGKIHIPVKITEDMVGHKLGEFALTRKFVRHGGKMQRELEAQSRQREVDAAKAEKVAAEESKK